MNKTYRLKQTRAGTLVAVPECARGRGKGTGRAALAAALILGAGSSAWAQGIVVNSGNTQVYNAPNGVPVVDIATANGAGLSHNRFTQYNVDTRGAVLNNNAPQTQAGPLQSQLAGQVVPNVNLSTEARIILNEVVVANRSTLAGYTEVLGKTADVVVANPWGITCNGCGFINTDRVTLTTGTPTIGAGGSLDGFRVNQGDILVQGNGLDARNQNVLDLVARSVKLDGQVNAQDMQVVAGSNDYAYVTRSATALTPTGTVPLYAIDSTALGGMYANRIRLLATEAGIGVRMLGEAAATADDFTLTAAGKIEIRGQLSAERDIALAYTGAASGGAAALEIAGSDAELAAKRDIALTVNNGAGATLSAAKLTAERNLSVTTGTLTDSGAAANTRFAGNDLTVTASGAASVNGSTWGTGNRLGMTVASLAVGGSGATLYSGADTGAADRSLNLAASSGNLNLANATLTAPTALNLTAALGGIQTGSGALLQAGGQISLAAATTMTHAGTLAGAANVSLTATDAQAALTNSGRIEAAGNLSLGGTGHLLDLTNQSGGVLIAGQALGIAGGALNNAGNIQAATGTQVTAASLTNQSGASFIASTTGSGTDSLALSGNFSNQGTIQSARVLNLSGNGFTNSGQLLATGAMTLTTGASATNSGQIIGQDAVTLTSSQSSFTLTNSGRLQSGGNLTLGATGHLLDLTNQSGGVLLAGQALGIAGGALTNAGTVQAATGTQVTAASFTNQSGANFIASTTGSGTDSLTLSGAFSNQGTVQAARALNVSGTGFANSGQLLATGAMALTMGASATNSGQIIGQDAVTLTSSQSSFTLANSGRLQSGGNLTLGGAGHLVALTNAAAGILWAGGNLQLAGGALDNQGKISSTGTLTLASSTLTNGSSSNSSALILGGGATQITASGSLDNYGAIHSNDASTLQAAGITNRATGGLSSLTTLALTATGGNAIDNYGALYAGNALSLIASGGAIFNRQTTGTIDSGGTITSSSANFTNNNTVVASGNITISTTNSFINQTPLTGVSKTLGAAYNARSFSQTQIANEGTLDAGMNAWLTEDTITRDEELVGITPAALAALPKAQIIATGAGSTLTINYGSSGLNEVAVISAPTVNISGTGTFTNQDLSLIRYDLRRRWIEIIDETAGDDYHGAWARTDPSRSGWDGDPDDDSKDLDNWHPGWGWGFVGRETNNSGTFSSTLRSWARSDAIVGAVQTGATVYQQFGAGIYATTFNFSGGTLNNISSPYPSDPNAAKAGSALGGSVGSLSASAPGAGSATGATPSSTVSGTGATILSLGGVNLTLPTNPNGYFVVSRNPSARYLVETNPLFAVGSNFVGSDYLARRYGYNPDDIQRRLGDANYEAYLIRQQLINQTGSNLLRGYGDEAAQMQRLMDQAAAQGQRLGFEWGRALTPAQIAGLTQDIVWMEEVVVNGQRVLAPRVYLAPTTVAGLMGGAVISAEQTTIAGDALNNTGGSIEGSKTLTVTTTGDIANTSGTLRGGDVSLTSTGGSIRNETVASTAGDRYSAATTIGKTAGIEATGNLNLDARKDITVTGGDVKAGGDASLAAGGNITFDTIVDKKASSSSSTGSDGWSLTTTGSETHIGSNLQTGGNLRLNSGGDTTLAGSKATVGGNLDVNTGGDFNVVARQDTATSQTVEKRSGAGVGGGVWGSETTTTERFRGTNVGSTLTVGGDTTVRSAGSMTLQGSDMNVAGNANIDATKGINILDGLNEERTTTHTETTTFLKVESRGESGADASASANASAGAGRAQASAQANAQAGASGSAEVKFNETTRTTTDTGSTASVASNLRVGGNLTARTEGTMTVQGSNVESGGDMNLQANNLDVLAGRNAQWSNTETNRSSFGIYASGSASADAGANAEARAGGLETGTRANAGASAQAEGQATIGARTEEERASSLRITNTTSTLRSGGNMNLTAKENATFVGAQVESGGDMTITGNNIINRAAEDIEINSSSRTMQTMGVYVGAEGKVKGGAEVDAGGVSVGNTPAAKVGGKAEVDASAGFRYAREEESKTEGSVTNVVSSFKAGGNLTRSASDTIEDRGTRLEAGGNIAQSAREIREVATEDRTFSTRSASSHDARIGVGAGASAEFGASSDGQASADAGAGAGIRASYKGNIAEQTEGSSTAVTTRYKAGGDIASRSEEKTTLIGTQMEAGGNVTLEAGALEIKAARDTTQRDATQHDISAKLKADMAGSASMSLEGGWNMNQESETTSTARTGSIAAGGNLTVKTRGDASFEGTQLQAGNRAAVDAGGKVDFKAAADTVERGKTTGNVAVDLDSQSDMSKGMLEGGFGTSSTAASTARAAGIQAGAGGVSVSAGKEANFEGTRIDTSGDAAIKAQGDVNLNAARNTETGSSAEISVDLKGRNDERGGSQQNMGANLRATQTDQVESTGTVIRAGGQATVEGANVRRGE